MRSSERYPRLGITGAVLGAIATVMGYGAGGFLVLSILIGSISILLRSKGPSALATLIYTVTVSASFYIVGFRIISDPLSTQTLLLFLCMIAIPTSLAAVVDGIRSARAN